MEHARRLLIRTLSRHQFESPGRAARILSRYAQTEDDSAWHFLQAAELVSNPRHVASLLATAVEETHHAYLLRELSFRYGAKANKPISRARLLSNISDIGGFIAFAQVSEHQVSKEFEILSHGCSDERIAGTFKNICADEIGHDHSTEDLLKEFIPLAEKRARAVAAARMKRTLSEVKEVGTAFADLIWAAVLCAVFFALGALFARFCRDRLEYPIQSTKVIEPLSVRQTPAASAEKLT